MHTTKYNFFRVVFSSVFPRGKEVMKGVLCAQRNHWKVKNEMGISCQYLSFLFLKSQDNILVLKITVAARTFALWRATVPRAALAQSTLFCCRMSCPAEVSPSCSASVSSQLLGLWGGWSPSLRVASEQKACDGAPGALIRFYTLTSLPPPAPPPPAKSASIEV